MTEFNLNVQNRALTGKKVRQLRTQGIVPVVVYGANQEAVSLQVAYRELELMLMRAGGTNVINLVSEGVTYQALAREVQRDSIKGTIKHVDFFAVDESARVMIDVPIYITGESAAVAARRAILLTGPTSLRIEMQATNMMDKVDIDLSNFPNVGDSLYVRDLNLGEENRILNDPDEMILRVAQSSAARREEALSKAAAVQEEA